jgi:hypothetical protein
MISASAPAIRRGVHPVAIVGPEKPKPGSEGATTWNCGLPSVNKGTTFANSAKVLGQPESKTIGNASSFAGALMDEVDSLAVDFGRELIEAVEFGFDPAPVEARDPVVDKLFEVRAVGPRVAKWVRPAPRANAPGAAGGAGRRERRPERRSRRAAPRRWTRRPQ